MEDNSIAMPFVVVVKDWDLTSMAPVAVESIRQGDRFMATVDLINFFKRHWTPVLPRLEAASHLSYARASLGTVIAVARDGHSTSEYEAYQVLYTACG